VHSVGYFYDNAPTSITTRMLTTSSNMVKFSSDSDCMVQSQLLELQTDTRYSKYNQEIKDLHFSFDFAATPVILPALVNNFKLTSQ
jgi:hypothetical protein